MELSIYPLAIATCALLVLLGVTTQRRRQNTGDDTAELVTVGRAATSLAHDLNNLLLVINGYAELIYQKDRSQLVKSNVKKIHDACDCANRLNSYVLSLIQNRDEPPVQIDVIGHLQTIEGVLSDLAGPSTEFSFGGSPQPLLVTIRKSYLDQILINLVVNSREARASSIHIRVFKSTALAQEEPSKHCFEVLDNGTGLNESALQSAAREYFSTGKQGATGIGLATVNRLVELSNGSFSINNRQHRKGAIAKVELPVANRRGVGIQPRSSLDESNTT